ncbi:MAG: hypothetical protein AAF518_21590 [Spirochaetota bacterium]
MKKLLLFIFVISLVLGCASKGETVKPKNYSRFSGPPPDILSEEATDEEKDEEDN